MDFHCIYIYIYTTYFIFMYHLCLYIQNVYIHTHSKSLKVTYEPSSCDFQRCECVFTCPITCKHVVSHVLSMHSLQVVVFCSFTVQPRVEYSLQCLSFKPRMSRSKHNSTGDVDSTTICSCTVLLYFSRYCPIRFLEFIFLCVFFMYYLCEKYYKLIIVQYYIPNCVSWVPRLSLLD